MSTNPNELWKKELKFHGYEHHCHSSRDLLVTKRLGQAWRRIFQVINMAPPARLFELGCGGGWQMVKLALNGFTVHGIDISKEVIDRANHFISEIKTFRAIQATCEVADILEYQSVDTYDMCFHFGVLEHFIDKDARQATWRKLYNLTKPGGWIVSVVPCGMHFMRNMIREQGLAGYHVPEMDYSCDLHRREFMELRLSPIYLMPHSFFTFLAYHPSILISKLVHPILFTLGNLLMPFMPIKEIFLEKCAHTLLACGKKGENSD